MKNVIVQMSNVDYEEYMRRKGTRTHKQALLGSVGMTAVDSRSVSTTRIGFDSPSEAVYRLKANNQIVDEKYIESARKALGDYKFEEINPWARDPEVWEMLETIDIPSSGMTGELAYDLCKKIVADRKHEKAIEELPALLEKLKISMAEKETDLLNRGWKKDRDGKWKHPEDKDELHSVYGKYKRESK